MLFIRSDNAVLSNLCPDLETSAIQGINLSKCMHTHPVNSTQLKTIPCVYLCNNAMHLCKLCWSMILVTHRETDWATLASTDDLFLHVDRQTVKLPGRHDSTHMPKQKASQHVAEGTRTVYSLVLSRKKQNAFQVSWNSMLKLPWNSALWFTSAIPIDFINSSLLYLVNAM